MSTDGHCFLHMSHYMSKFKLCVSIDVHFLFVQVFACQMSKTSKNFVKHIYWWLVNAHSSHSIDEGGGVTAHATKPMK